MGRGGYTSHSGNIVSLVAIMADMKMTVVKAVVTRPKKTNSPPADGFLKPPSEHLVFQLTGKPHSHPVLVNLLVNLQRDFPDLKVLPVVDAAHPLVTFFRETATWLVRDFIIVFPCGPLTEVLYKACPRKELGEFGIVTPKNKVLLLTFYDKAGIQEVVYSGTVPCFACRKLAKQFHECPSCKVVLCESCEALYLQEFANEISERRALRDLPKTCYVPCLNVSGCKAVAEIQFKWKMCPLDDASRKRLRELRKKRNK